MVRRVPTPEIEGFDFQAETSYIDQGRWERKLEVETRKKERQREKLQKRLNKGKPPISITTAPERPAEPLSIGKEVPTL